MTADKADVRAYVLASRRAMSPEARAAAGTTICRRVLDLAEVVVARTAAAYLSIGTEPWTADLLEALLSNDVRIILPVLRDDLDLDWAEYGGRDRLAQGALGLWSPLGPRLPVEEVATADVVVVPALAVDAAGVRLGRGGGSYDRALARVPTDRLVVALLYDGERRDVVPSEAHDRPVTAVVTPSETHRFPTEGAG